MIFGKDLTPEIKAVLSEKNVFAITDDNVFSLYRDLFIPERTYIIEHGEGQKHLGTVSGICAFLLNSGADRHSKIAAVGGGVPGDIAGFAAAVYMRGIPWVNIPTTLLAQVDSGIGGKTGVDLAEYKNMIGAFHFPNEIYLSAHFLSTLDVREFLCGIGEAVKTACLSPEIFSFYKDHEAAIYQKDEAVLEQLVKLCAEFKNSIVEKDPCETKGLRKILNYGHTAGHAFEAADCHARSHGEYILYGILAENYICKNISDPDFYSAAEKLIRKALGNQKPEFDLKRSAKAAAADKKNADGKISVLAAVRPGEYREVFFTKTEFRKKLEEAALLWK